MRLIHKYSPILFALIFIIPFIFTNIFDWDFFLTTIEVDLRSWVIEGLPPDWSYQFCGGSTRSGDPQSYGLSPLIIFPILFNSFWGAKVLLFLGIVTGAIYFRKIIQLLDPDATLAQTWKYLTAFFVMNFFLFHFFTGHLPFSSFFFAFPLFHLLLKISLGNKIEWKEHLLNFIFLCLAFTGPFYQVSVYFLLPMAIGFILYLALNGRRIHHKKDVLYLVFFSVAAVLVCFYRIYPALKYQLEHPRTIVGTAGDLEWNYPHFLLSYFLAPIQGRRFWVPVPGSIPFGANENSFFGAFSYIFLFIILIKPREVLAKMRERKELYTLFITMFLTGAILSLGSLNNFMPFTLLNQLFQNSIRVIGRFNFITYLALTCMCITLLGELRFKRWQKISIYVLFVFLPITSLFQHTTWSELMGSARFTKTIISAEPVYNEKMKEIYLTHQRNLKMSFMYFPTLYNVAVINCYQPMIRPIKFMPEVMGGSWETAQLHFIETEEQPSSCLENSYFTQQSIHIDYTCRKGSRVRLNGITQEDLNKLPISDTKDGYFIN